MGGRWYDQDDDQWKDIVPEPSPEERYICSRCKAVLQLSIVKRVERMPAQASIGAYGQPTPGDGRSTVRIIHVCTCTGEMRVTRYPWVDSALRGLFGGDYILPWPLSYGETHDGEAVSAPPPSIEGTPYERREAVVSRWSWDIEMSESVQDFLNQMRGPWWRDSEVRAEVRGAP